MISNSIVERLKQCTTVAILLALLSDRHEFDTRQRLSAHENNFVWPVHIDSTLVGQVFSMNLPAYLLLIC
jgi:hypothetical protein